MNALTLVGPSKVRVSPDGVASAMADDCKAWLFVGETPEWAPGNADVGETGRC